MPLDIIRRLLTPILDPVPTSRYPSVAPLLQPATRGLPEVDLTACRQDGACIDVCPTAAIELAEGGSADAHAADAGADGSPDAHADVGADASAGSSRTWSVDAGKCIFCEACAIACPNAAIRMSSRVELAATDRAALVERGGASETAPAAERLRSGIAGRFGRSLHVRHLDAGSCNGCDWEIAALLNPYHDLQRLGIDFVASPRHADLLLVTGVMTANLAEAARRTYEAMPEPRLVVAVGACAISGGVFAGAPGCGDGVAASLPVDVFVPGCPPRPEALIEGMLTAIETRRAGARAGASIGQDGLRGRARTGSVEW
jgi:Ni,Fe-hydrogenase III small subunit/formate hydrogenlyase subunit 6/NADH:ubiquinone oxidoreductase subunit I